MSDDVTSTHCVQYATLGLVIVYGTEEMTNLEIRARTRFATSWHIERFDRCPVCEVWTRYFGRLRDNIACPAVRAAIARAADKPGLIGRG